MYTTIAFGVSVDAVCVAILVIFFPLNMKFIPLEKEVNATFLSVKQIIFELHYKSLIIHLVCNINQEKSSRTLLI